MKILFKLFLLVLIRLVQKEASGGRVLVDYVFA